MWQRKNWPKGLAFLRTKPPCWLIHPARSAAGLYSNRGETMAMESPMLIGYVSDEYYAALPDATVELIGAGEQRVVVRSSASGAVTAGVSPGEDGGCLAKPGFGFKRVKGAICGAGGMQFRLLSDRLLGYAWPKWCRSSDKVEFRIHTVEPYKLGLWRYGIKKEFIRNIGWYDNHGPRACMQTVPDGFFVETGVA